MSTVSGEAVVLWLLRPVLLERRGAPLVLLAAGEAGGKSCGRAATLRFLGGDLPMAILLLVQHDTSQRTKCRDYQKINRCLSVDLLVHLKHCSAYTKFNIAA